MDKQKKEKLLKGCGLEFKFAIGDSRGTTQGMLICGQVIASHGYYCDACSSRLITEDTEKTLGTYARKISRYTN